MKRVLKIAVSLILTLTTLCFTIGADCTLYTDDPFPPLGLEWDGRFLYYPVGNEYAIVGTEPEFGVKSEVIDKLYLPYYYNGKRVLYYDHQFYYGGTPHNFGIDALIINEIYCPYQYVSYYLLPCEDTFKKIYVPEATYVDSFYYRLHTNSPIIEMYIASIMFDKYYNKMIELPKITVKEKKDWRIIFESRYIPTLIERILYKANTAYMFNYEGSPNEDYYFINNFERGGLIENTPYEPFREGYEFTDWYKDAECTQKWNFEVDTLPEPTYDENGELEYVETRLYAGWNKI